MRVLIFHGYLLRGTGSNVYNASLARALARLGHEVHLFCQDREAASLGWVDRVGRWTDRGLEVDAVSGVAGPGSINVYVPDIGGLLPVFVADRYEGFEVKTFPELTDAELEAYLEANVAAVRDVVESVGETDAAAASHLVMGPVILARAGLRYALKIHGSDLSYTVLPHLDRFGRYAREAVARATAVLVSTEHIAARLLDATPGPEVEAKLRLAPPGVDTQLFAPLPRSRRASALRDLAQALRRGSQDVTVWNRDPGRAAEAVEWLADSPGARVVFVGKLIVSKGIDLLLAAWPLVHAANPGARLLVVGFGEYEEASRRMWSALEAGDLDAVREVAGRGRALEGGEEAPLAMLSSFLDRLPSDYPDAAAAAANSVAFAGRLEHDEVGRVVPAADVQVVPSTFPESFGMVAAEAAAAGTAPVSAAHSGLAEVSRELAEPLPPQAAGLVSFELGERAVESLASRINGWLALEPEIRDEALAALREVAARNWGWEGVAKGILAASAGDVEELPSPHVPGATSADSRAGGGRPEQ
jgi:glycosyltransferase involved in cell wall biosynthesis